MAFDHADLEETEDVLGIFYGGRGQVGGQLLVMNRRLLFGPIDIGLARVVALDGVQAAGVRGLGMVKGLLDAYEPLKQKQIWLRHVKAVEAKGKASLFSLPKIRITTVTDEVVEYGIAKSTTTPNIHPGNNAKRDEAISVIRDAMSRVSR